LPFVISPIKETVMALTQELSNEELGALLEAVGYQMRTQHLCFSAALDGNGTQAISEKVEDLLHCDPERADEIATMSDDAVIARLGMI
jgi:hypothetical protein